MPTVRVAISPGSPKSIDIAVEDVGPRFGFEDAIVVSTEDVRNGRHHSLWRVKRLASAMDE
jgi:hypothetical protein